VFFSPAEHWWYADRAGKPVSFQTAFNVEEHLHNPMALTPAQEFALIDASEPDQVLALLQENLPDQISRLPLPDQHEFIVRNVQAAREIGLSSTPDFVLYVAVALIKGERYIKGPQWANLCNDAKFKRSSFSEVIGKLETDEYKEAV
jgi:hypothetical protein